MCNERLAMCDGQPRDAQRHPKLEVIPQLASSQVFLLGAEESDSLAQPSLGTLDHICFPSLDFLASKLPSSRNLLLEAQGSRPRAGSRSGAGAWSRLRQEQGQGQWQGLGPGQDQALRPLHVFAGGSPPVCTMA